MWIDVITLFHMQVQHKGTRKECLFVLSGNCTGIHLLKSSDLKYPFDVNNCSSAKDVTHFITLYDMALDVAKSEVYLWLIMIVLTGDLGPVSSNVYLLFRQT